MNRLYTIKEASDIIGVTPKTLKVWEKEGKIEPIKTFGGHRRYSENVINDCMITKPSIKKMIRCLEMALFMAKELRLNEFDELNNIINKINYEYK